MKTKAPKVKVKCWNGWDLGAICIDTYVDEKLVFITDLPLEAAEELLKDLTSVIANYKRMDEDLEEDTKAGLFDGPPIKIDDIEF